MSVDSALQVLGLSGAPSQDEIRRAYLRKVKEHPPERDRDAFQRVREAFDFLKAYGRGLLVEESEAPPLAPVPTAEAPEAAPVPAFSPEVVPPQLAIIEQALGEDDPVVAAEAMLELYGQGLEEAGPVPAPIFTLRTFMALMARNRFELGRALLAAFEKHEALHGSEAGVGPEVGARWRLAKEVAALSNADEPMTRAIAQSLNGGHIYTAAEAVQDAYARGVHIERLMNRHAPTVWTSLAPYVQVSRDEVARATGTRVPGWAGWVFLIVMVNVIRLCSYDPPDAPRISFPGERPVQTEEQRAQQGERHPETPPVSTLTFRERAQRDVDAKWLGIAVAAERGDCDAVREQWPPYRKVADHEIVKAATDRERKQLILSHCPQVVDLLEEQP
jgi:hypothetical protein